MMIRALDEFALPTLGAIALEFSRLPEMFRVVRRFERAAVLVDEAWLRKASEIEGALIPGLELRVFERDQEAEAEAVLCHRTFWSFAFEYPDSASADSNGQRRLPPITCRP